MTNASAKYSALPSEKAISDFESHPDIGLSPREVLKRRNEHGWNELEEQEKDSLISKFFDKFKDPLILLLFGSAIISVFMGHVEDAVSISLAILIVVIVAFIQEYKSEQSLQALNKLVPHNCHVLRSGDYSNLLAKELCPGDIVKFSIGDRIPADLRIIKVRFFVQILVLTL